MNRIELHGWDSLRHGGLLLDPQRLSVVAAHAPDPLPSFYERDLRKRIGAILDAHDARTADVSAFVAFVLQQVCGLSEALGKWQRGSQVPPEWGRVAITGETVKPRHLWRGPRGGVLPVFIDREKRVGMGRGRKATSQVLGWLRAGDEQLALVTNGRQWRLLFAGLDFDAWCEWDIDLWLAEGDLSPQVTALRTLLQPALWTPPEKDTPAPLLQAIQDSRKGQAELSAVLGERVREAVEVLVQSHGEALRQECADVDPARIYRAAVRVVMRLVVLLFAESRELLPRDNALYHDTYGLGGLLEKLEKTAAHGGRRLARSWGAWPRVIALFRLVHQGSHHPSLPVPAYGGELFAPGDAQSPDGLIRALAVFENACFDREALPDSEVHTILEHITRTRIKVRQGRSSTWVPAPVDFSDLSSEYIGILYEGLLDFELKTAPAGDPVIFLAVGNQPALPLSRLEKMDDKALKELLEKMKDTSSDDAGDEEEETDETGGEPYKEPDDEASGNEGEVADNDKAELEQEDERHSTRTRAETWARRAVEVGRLVKKPRGKLTPGKKLVHEATIARKARQLVTRVVLPGEWYLVRWGGTRKGSGTFYTRPGLAVPTVQRTLRPLAWTAPAGKDGAPEMDAPPLEWAPKKPEEILTLKVVDPACGSGTFPVAALRFLTDALYASLHHHRRIQSQGDRSVVALLTGKGGSGNPEERLCEELLPCRPDDALFEPRLKAILRRHVVERCIYGVDLDPLAVELCRLALWVETMDRTLPFSFLDHKIKCGNSLVGAWFDQFQHFPAMAFKNREGGDKGHSNGVHFTQNVRTKAIKAFVKETLAPDLASHLIPHAWTGMPPLEVHDDAVAVLEKLHEMPVVEAAERARLYRKQLLGSDSWQQLRAAMDIWCACWFWPADRLDCAPLPSRFADPEEETAALSTELAAEKRFFHWELEFPDVFRTEGAGFDAVLGNPPWETLQPNSKEFFSNIDPLYRSYGKQEALRYQTEYFQTENIERDWLEYTAGFANDSNWMKLAANPFGDPDRAEKPQDRFGLERGRRNQILHATWREARAKNRGYADPRHPFRHRGEGKAYTYKLFLEQAHALLRTGGRIGFIVPSGLYSDHGTGALRELFLEHCSWEWLFGFENREKIFDIDSRFKFNPVIIEKGGETRAIRTAFMRRKLEDWERAKSFVTPYTIERIERFSPRSKVILEIQSTRDLEILEKIYANSVLLGDDGPDGWGIKYAQGDFNMTSDSKLFPPRPKWEEKGYSNRNSLFWESKDGRRAFALCQGAMIWQFDLAASAFAGGGGHAVRWDRLDWTDKKIAPQYLLAEETLLERVRSIWEWRIAYRYLGNSTNQRTMIAALVRAAGCGHTVGILLTAELNLQEKLFLVSVINSYVFDWVARQRFGGSGGVTALDPSKIVELPLPRFTDVLRPVSQLTASLCFASHLTTDAWLSLGVPDSVVPKAHWAVTYAERLRLRCIIDATISSLFSLSVDDVERISRACDLSVSDLKSRVITKRLDQKGFWRIDKDKDPELRHTVLTLVAFHDLQQKIDAAGGDRDAGIEAFCTQNDGEGWMLPETLRLADYGLGHDDRAKEHQPVASRLGPRFYDWQLAQTPEESWRECHLHARNLLGEAGYQKLLADIEAEKNGKPVSRIVKEPPSDEKSDEQRRLFE